MTISSPKVLISLCSDGTLALELPGANEGTRTIPLKPGRALDVIREVLFSLALGNVALATDGAPTAAQVRHWERHGFGQQGEERCAFCRAEGRFGAGNTKGSGGDPRVLSSRQSGDVTIRRLKPGMSGAQYAAHQRQASKSLIAAQRAEELGL